MRWCEENTLTFVKLYLDKECLWNPAHEWYKAKFKREIAYSDIIAEFKKITGKGMTIPEVKIKIKNLRSTYTQQVQKILQKSSPDYIYQPSLIWFHEMDRCLKYVPNARTPAAEFSQEMHEVDSEQALWPNQNKIIPSSIEEGSSDPLIPLLYSDNEYNTSATQQSVVKMETEQDSSPEYLNVYLKRKRKKLKKNPHHCRRSLIENWSKDDEFDIYGKYIASQLRKMQLQRALKVQLEIQNLVNEARVSASED